MIRDILVNLTQGADTDIASDFAISLAAKYGAHITGLSVTYEIDVPPFYMGALPTDFIDAQVLENQAAAEKAATAFKARAAAAGVPHEVRSISASLGVAATTFSNLGRLFDLTVVAQPDPDKPGPEEVIAETVLLEAGRAVLVVPYVQKAPFTGGRAVVAWDGSRAAARALAEALPLLHRCEAIEVFSVQSGKSDDEEEGQTAEVVRHLARHGLNAQVRKIYLGDGESVAAAILNEVADQSADLVVMGGYGHSRFRELVMGGVTREILSSMTAPVLMAH